MSSECCVPPPPAEDKPFKRVLWIALIVNLSMFLIEVASGLSSGSTALLADAADFFGDAANYAISLLVLPLGLLWRARAALFKGISMGVYGVAVLGYAAYNAATGVLPEPFTMGVVGALAFAS